MYLFSVLLSLCFLAGNLVRKKEAKIANSMQSISKVIAWFVVIFGINTTSDISKLFYIISRAVRRVKFETIFKYHKWYLCQISLQIMLLFVYTTTRKGFVIFTCRYFKLSWNTTALSQSNCRNFSCSSINIWMNELYSSVRVLSWILVNCGH